MEEERPKDPMRQLHGVLPGTDLVMTLGVRGDGDHAKRTLSVTYDDRLNLFSLDKRVRAILGNSPDSPLLSLYEKATRSILDSYALASPTQARREGKSPTLRDPQRSHLSGLVDSFLDYVGKYVELKVVRPQGTKGTSEEHPTCDECYTPLEERPDSLYCPECLTLHPPRVKMEAVTPDAFVSKRNMNDRRAHLRTIILEFQGEEDYEVKEEHLSSIREYARRYSVDPASMGKDYLIDVMATLIERRVLPEDIADHATLVHHRITGAPLPDIAHITDRIYARDEEVMSVYHDVKPAGRQYSLKSWYLFYQYLCMEEYEVDASDFPLFRMRGTLVEHNQMMRKICTVLTERGSQFTWRCVDVTW